MKKASIRNKLKKLRFEYIAGINFTTIFILILYAQSFNIFSLGISLFNK